MEAGLFSTALGRLLLYSAEELQTEWDRLEQLPPARLEDEIRPDAPIIFDGKTQTQKGLGYLLALEPT